MRYRRSSYRARPPVDVRIDVSELDANQQRWSSWGVFKADADGRVSTRQPAIAGTYTGADEAGVFWSMRPQVEGAMYSPHAHRITSAIEASVDGQPVGRPLIRRNRSGRRLNDQHS